MGRAFNVSWHKSKIRVEIKKFFFDLLFLLYTVYMKNEIITENFHLIDFVR